MKIKSLVYLVILSIALASCSESEKKSETISPKIARYDVLKDLFKENDLDTLYVYSTGDTEDKNFRYKGTKLDSIQVRSLNYWIRKAYSDVNEVAACSKFDLTPGITAMIVRTPGEYSSTNIELLLFDRNKDSVVKSIYLADVLGDAGENYSFTSCIFKDREKGRMLLSYSINSFDHNINGDPNDTIVEISRDYFLLDLNKNFGDTVSKDSAFIVSKYSRIAKKLMGDND